MQNALREAAFGNVFRTGDFVVQMQPLCGEREMSEKLEAGRRHCNAEYLLEAV